MREKNADFYFIIDSEFMHVVQEYSYSGTRMSSSGNFSVLREHLKEKLFMLSSAWDDTPISANLKQLSVVKYLILWSPLF